jgi:MFS family permease
MVLWGIGMGSQSTLIKAAIGNLIPQHKRGSAYGLIDTLYGVSWFIGSALMGWLYDHSISAIVLFSLLLQLAAIPFFFYARQSLKML